MRILLVEDDRDLARVTADAIRDAGLAVDVAADGQAALERAREFEYDLVVLDLLLPRVHGLTVLKTLKAEQPALPVLVLTALDQVEERVDGLDRGADDYVVKPFAVAELLARVRALLRRSRVPATSSVVEVGDLRVDLAARTVRRAGRELRLTPREYALLVLFLSRPGAALSREEIGERVVDRVFEPSSNLIDVSIHGLRQKLGEPPLITTVRGVGYRFDPPGAA